MNYEIIEDCSPFYIRYRHPGIEKIINTSLQAKKTFIDPKEKKQSFIHYRLPLDIAATILMCAYKAKELNFIEQRVSLFVTQPGYYYRPHKDGLAIPVGINYNIDIQDEKCVTSWYSDETFKDRPIDTLNGVSREIGDFDRRSEINLHTPLKSMIAKPGEAVLFNTNYYHSVNNIESRCERTILTLRSKFFEKMDFFQARKILFEF